MSNPNRPCHSFLDADENLVEHIWTPGQPECGACGWAVCVMPGCKSYVADAGTRCSECHPHGCPCESCVDWDSDGVPVAVAEEETSAQTVETRTLSDAEMLAILDEMVECAEAA